MSIFQSVKIEWTIVSGPLDRAYFSESYFEAFVFAIRIVSSEGLLLNAFQSGVLVDRCGDARRN